MRNPLNTPAFDRWLLAKNWQALLPMMDLIEPCRLACDELIDVIGRAAIQAVLQPSAIEAAGGRSSGASGAQVTWRSAGS